MGALGLVLATVASCSGATTGTQVQALLDVQITLQPLGDVVLGELEAGDAASAECFVDQAQSNAGIMGSAVRITSGRTTGYTPVTTLPNDPTARRMVYDLDEGALRAALPSCLPSDGNEG